MNILVDGRTFCAPSAGITTVLKCVLMSWGKMFPNDVLYVIIPKRRRDDIVDIEFPPNVIWIEAKSPLFKKLPNLVYLQLMAPLLAKKYLIDIYYSPTPSIPYFIPKRIKTIIGVNDVVNIEFKDTMVFTNKLANTLLFNRSVKSANLIWTISNYTKAKVEEYFPNRNCKDIFVGCATDRNIFKKLNLSSNEVKELKLKFGIKDKFALFVGSLEPRKNLPFLLDVIPELYQFAGVQLVVVGAKGWKNSAIKEKVMEESFPKDSTIFCGYVSNEELVQLYNMADCFVSASLNEGFGLPQLEAFLCGCPVVTSANSAMIEVTDNKDAGCLIEGYDKNVWIKKIVEMVNRRPKVDTRQFDEYNWDVIVKKLREEKIPALSV